MATITIEVPDDLHPNTANLVRDFAAAMAGKLRRAELKHGYSDGWLTQDWEAECMTAMYEHLVKGDPLDVANYCAFIWRRGWSTRDVPRECTNCRDLMQLRRTEGKEIRNILGPGMDLATLEALSHVADALECGNPLGDCGCEGSCFTRGERDAVDQAALRSSAIGPDDSAEGT